MSVFPATLLASALLAGGELGEAAGVVRAGLAAGGNTIREADIRLAAATLAVHRGANEAAREHMLRAHGKAVRPRAAAGSHGRPARRRGVAGRARPGRAFELVDRVLPVNAVDPRVVDDLLVWGARVAADLVGGSSTTVTRPPYRPIGRRWLGLSSCARPCRGRLSSLPARPTPPRRPRPPFSRPSRVEPREPRTRSACGGRRSLRVPQPVWVGSAGLDLAARRGADRVRLSGHRGGGSAPRSP